VQESHIYKEQRLAQDQYESGVRIGRDEIDRILDLKAELDRSSSLIDYANKYLNLGWRLAAINVESGRDLRIDFKEENWAEFLGGSGINASKINLGVYTGSLSGLLVLEVANEAQKSFLDGGGEWRSHCTAELGAGLEKHFYSLPSAFQGVSSKFLANGVTFWADGDITLLPPSIDSIAQRPWQWQHPPWEIAPSPLPLTILHLLQSTQENGAGRRHRRCLPPVSWQELYCLISPFETVLQAFTNRAASKKVYYEKLLKAALEAGFTDSEILLSLLWHAPLGDAQHCPESWHRLQNLVSLAQTGEWPEFPNLAKESSPGFPRRALLRSGERRINKRQPISRRGEGYEQ